MRVKQMEMQQKFEFLQAFCSTDMNLDRSKKRK